MKGKKTRSTLVPMITTALLVGTASAAAAATVSSGVGDMGVNYGRHYYNQAVAIADAVNNTGWTDTWVSGTTKVSSGWIGSEARLFRDTGALCKASGMGYNPAAATTYSRSVYNTSCPADYYYAYGKSAAWNGNGYTYYYTLRTPNIYMN
jgi:hypothetical protein